MWLELGPVHVLAINVVLFLKGQALMFGPSVRPVRGVSELFNIAYPLVAFLSAHQIKGCITLMISGSAVLPVVMVVGYLVRVHAVFV